MRETFKSKTIAKKVRCGFKATYLTCGLVLQEKSGWQGGGSQEMRCSQPFLERTWCLAGTTWNNPWLLAFLSNMRLMLTFEVFFISEAACAAVCRTK